MTQLNQKFLSYIESRVQDKGELYARFHLGSFVAGQSLTVANALRRTLLAEIPGFVITQAQIQGATHEFANIPGVQENVLNIVLNLKKLVVTIKPQDFETLIESRQELIAALNVSGPKQVTAADIQFPAGITPVDTDHHIATLGANGELKLTLGIQFIDPCREWISKKNFSNTTGQNQLETQKLVLNTQPNPVRQVNYGIRQVEDGNGQEYISLEIWTDGSLDPKYTLDCALERLTKTFYQFTTLSKNKQPF